jgi:excisionase family DNA binding protein
MLRAFILPVWRAKMMFENLPDVLNVRELAGALKIGRNNAYELVRSGAIKSVVIGRQIRISKQEIIAFMEGKRHEA